MLGPDDVFDVGEGVALGVAGESLAEFQRNFDSPGGVQVRHRIGSFLSVDLVGSVEPFKHVVSVVSDEHVVLGRGHGVPRRVGAEQHVSLGHGVGSGSERGDGELGEVDFDGVVGGAVVDAEAGDEEVLEVVGGDGVEVGGGADGGLAN